MSAVSIILIIGAGGACKIVWQELVNEATASLATSFDIVGLARYSHDKYKAACRSYLLSWSNSKLLFPLLHHT